MTEHLTGLTPEQAREALAAWEAAQARMGAFSRLRMKLGESLARLLTRLMLRTLALAPTGPQGLEEAAEHRRLEAMLREMVNRGPQRAAEDLLPSRTSADD